MLRLVGSLCLVALFVPVPLSAQSDPRDTEARRLYEAGELAFADGRYQVALERFEESHELSGRGELLFNMAMCLDRLRRDEEAIQTYERYLEAVADAPNRHDVEVRVRAMRDAQAQAQAVAEATVVSEGATPGGGSTDPPSVGIEQYWWAFVLGGVVLAAAVAVPIVVVTQSGTEAPLPGDFGAGGVIVALEVRP